MASSNTLPSDDSDDVLARASLTYPSQSPDAFSLSPLLTLPPAFGAAYVGETFACTLCANNEIGSQPGKVVKDVKIHAELQTPTSQPKGIELEFERSSDESNREEHRELETAESVQGIVRHDLREEGTHVLVATVTYTEVVDLGGGSGETSAKTRTFRKLYQFVAQQALGVRTKVGEIQSKNTTTGSNSRRFTLEAQLENMTEQTILLDSVSLDLGKSLKSRSFRLGEATKPILAPQDVEQVAFLLEQTGEDLEENAGRFVLAQLAVDWRVSMGEQGTLKTGWLGSRRR